VTKDKFSDRFRKALEKIGVKQVDFANSIGIAQSTVSTFLSGKSLMSRSTALLIEQIYGISADWLLDGTGHMEVKKNALTQDLEFTRKILKDPELKEIIESLLELKKSDRAKLFGVIRGFIGEN
jgi:transcriptional regulator with XRE-family HTH domain